MSASDPRSFDAPPTAPVVVGVDRSGPDRDAVGWAAAEAALRGAPLCVVAAFPWPLPPSDRRRHGATDRSALRARTAGHLAEAAALARAAVPGLAVETRLAVGRPVAGLVAAARTAQLLVLGIAGPVAAVSGSVAIRAMARAVCPVVVVRGATRSAGQEVVPLPVVVGIDGTSRSDAATGFAFAVAADRGAPLVAVHTYTETVQGAGCELLVGHAGPVHEALLAERLRPWIAAHPKVPVECLVVRDDPRSALLDHAAGAQLLVVGSRGHGGAVGLVLDSVSSAAVRCAPCPVAVVRESAARRRPVPTAPLVDEESRCSSRT
jgi:nucleotide-binding universal stress UspA family protein